MNYNNIDTKIPTLGKSKIASPIQQTDRGSYSQNFISDNDRVLIDVNLSNVTKMIKDSKKLPAFELAGPRKKIYFDPSKLRCALVACGGLCPGLNGVTRSIVLELYYGYGVRNVYGIQYGLQGFIPKYG
ncbi:MAG: ATP-dependent 6-phosphofructokinase, partial [Desulfobacterales bacterium]|nr:ATP-dependent 6-phosphofructokinase [Desulfobacterales bacterium]